MEKLLIYIKHHLKFLWNIIEFGNEVVFAHNYGVKLEEISEKVISEFAEPSLIYRKLSISDAESLYDLFNSQSPGDLAFFNPHGFELDDFKKTGREKVFFNDGSLQCREACWLFLSKVFCK